MAKHNFRFYHNCVNWPRADVNRKGGLCDLISDRVEVTRKTFLSHVDPWDRQKLERILGYCRGGLTMARDWHVGYYRSKWHGKTVYLFTHSAIEYVFTKGRT